MARGASATMPVEGMQNTISMSWKLYHYIKPWFSTMVIFLKHIKRNLTCVAASDIVGDGSWDVPIEHKS